MSRLLAIVRTTWFRRGIIGLYVLALMLLIGAYIGISTFRVETAAYLRGQSTLEKGRPHAMRGALLETASGQFRRDARWTFELKGAGSEGRAVEVAQVHSDRWGVLESAFSVPDGLEAGEGTLELTVTGPDFPTFRASRAVDVVESREPEFEWPERTPRLPAEERNARTRDAVVGSSGALAIDVLPRDGELVRGLENAFFVRTYVRETGEPVAARVSFEQVKGMGRWGGGRGERQIPAAVETGALGLARVEVKPVGGQRLELSAREIGDGPGGENGERTGEDGERSGEATVRLHTVAAQFSIDLKDRLVLEGGRLRGEVDSVFPSKRLFVDLFNGGDWIGASSVPVHEYGAALEMPLPDQAAPHWLYRVQLYQNIYAAGDTWESAWFVRADGRRAADYREAVGRLAELIGRKAEDPYYEYLADAAALEEAGGAGRAWKRRLEAATMALPRHFTDVAPLYNTQKGDKEELTAWKKGVKGWLMTIIAAAFVGALAVLVWVVLRGLGERRAHRRRLREVDVEMAGESGGSDDGGSEAGDLEGAEEPVDTLGWGGRLSVVLLVVIGLATFVMFGLGVLMVLTFM